MRRKLEVLPPPGEEIARSGNAAVGMIASSPRTMPLTGLSGVLLEAPARETTNDLARDRELVMAPAFAQAQPWG